MLGHFTVDMFGGLLPVLYPIMSDRFDLSNADIGFIALAYTAASSLSQPLFGYLADRWQPQLCRGQPGLVGLDGRAGRPGAYLPGAAGVCDAGRAGFRA